MYNRVKTGDNMSKYDVVAIGELLIDFMSCGLSENDNPIYEASPGGAPGNVLAMLEKLDRKTAFIGKVGDDLFGKQLLEALNKCGIETSGVIVDEKINTTLAFVKNEEDGERSFSFFRNPGADTCLSKDEIDYSLIDNSKIFHFGTLSLTHEPVKTATISAVDYAISKGLTISFDPNLRPLLWDDLEQAKKEIAWGCSKCNVLKIADEELEFFTDTKDLERGISLIKETYPNIKLIFLTKGKEGAKAYWGNITYEHEAFITDKTIDTTGAGDTFMGSCLSFVVDSDLDKPNFEVLKEMVIFASAAASVVTTRKGALLSMPGKYEVLDLL